MKQENTFTFAKSKHLPKVTLLMASMYDFSYGKHAHEEFAIGCTLKGMQNFFCKGSHFSSTPGNVMFINPEENHDGHPGDNTPLEYIMLYISPDQLSPLMDASANKPLCSHRPTQTIVNDYVMQQYIFSLAHTISTQRYSALEQEFLLYKLANRLTQHMGHGHPNQWKKHKDAMLLTVKDYIHTHAMENISIDDLCVVANLSKYHFIRTFRNQFGITPHQYVVNYRINTARKELESGLPPSDVAQKTGFADVSHLNRRFKKSFGITPKQYQQQLFH